MKKTAVGLIGIFTLCSGVGCTVEKDITVITREQGSGTREAFDKVVTDGQGNYLQMKINGKDKFFTVDTADIQKETGNIISKVAKDIHAVGYISLGGVNESIKVLQIDGVRPSTQTVLSGDYIIQRPFVIASNENVALTALAADFLAYLQSDCVEERVAKAGYIFLSDPILRGEANAPIAVGNFTAQARLPAGDKIVVNGSTSMEKLIVEVMKGYAELYSTTADKIFTLDLQGSSVGVQKVQGDKTGRVIGLSSASVREEGVRAFQICLDAVAVIVHKDNPVKEVSLGRLYDIYTGKIRKYNEWLTLAGV